MAKSTDLCTTVIEYIKGTDPHCGGMELQNNLDNFTIMDMVDNHLSAGGATVNVFKLLGVHEQGELMDVTGNGTPLSGGDGPGFDSGNAYNKLCGSWRSVQRGSAVLTHAFIGYDFGEIRPLNSNAAHYAIETFNHKHIATIRIQQGPNKRNRATKVRVERSQDGITWLGASIVKLPDDHNFHQIALKGSAASRFWRVRPIEFNGDEKDFWEVIRLEMHEYEETQLSNIQYDGGFLENRDRDYAETSIPIKMYYDIVETRTELTQFAFELTTQQLNLDVSFKQSIQLLGRPIVIGDILELPTEIQYTADLRGVKKYMEVIDVTWSTNGYTPGWLPTLQRLTAVPMMASQETQDIIGDPSIDSDDIGFYDIDDSQVVDYTDINDRIRAEYDTNTPERGKDVNTLRHFSQEEIDAARQQGVDLTVLNHPQRALYAEDAMPPNNEPYTESDSWPQNPRDGDWHRLTYKAVGDARIPSKLFKYSTKKQRWVYYETDRRDQYNLMKPTIQEALMSSKKIASTKKKLTNE